MGSDSPAGPGTIFPDPAELQAALESIEIEANLTVADAATALQANARLENYEDIEDLAIKSVDSTDAQGLIDTMLPIRNAIANELRARELLVGVEIIDNLIFEALGVQDGTPVVQSVIDALCRRRVGEAGLLVFAVHSLGLTADDLGALLERTGVEVIDNDWGLAISPQTNSLDRTVAFLERVRMAFGIQGGVRRDLIEHWRRSRPTRWLECNPLLVVRVAEASGSYYGNEAMLLTRLQAATVLVSMLAAAQPANAETGRPTMSTYVLNNQQTLDIHHYLVLSPGRAPGDELDGDCVPISRVRPDMVGMSELRIDLNLDYWANNKLEADGVAHAVAAIYRAYLGNGFDPTRGGDEARRNRRWFEAQVYFQRSFSGQSWRDIITLSTAFELLLHDPSRGDTSKSIRRAIRRLSGSASEGDRHAEAFGRVYRARNEIVHGGVQATSFDIEQARCAFVSAFLGHVKEEGLV